MGAAYLLNSAARRGLTGTEGLISLIRYLRSEIECFSMPLPRALARCPRQILEACGYSGASAPESIRQILPYVSDSVTRAQMSRFCDEIGKGYLDEQLSLCDYYIEVLEERRRELATQLPPRRKVNSVLCLSGALAIVILLF